MFMEEAEEVKAEEATTETEPATDGANDNVEGGEGDKKAKAVGNNTILLIAVGVLSLLLVVALVLMFTPLGDGILGRSKEAHKTTEHTKAKAKEGGKNESHAGADDQHGDPILEEIEGESTAHNKSVSKGEHEEGKGEHGAGASGETIFVEIPNIIINIKNRTRRTKFLKMSIYLEVDSEAVKTKILKIQPRIIDQFQLYARNLDQDDLEGAVGLQRLRVELLKRVRRVLAPDKVHNILFREIIIQ